MINSIFNRFNHSIVTEKITIKEAMRLLGKSKIHILILINKNNQLEGTITDGDIRRSILKGHNLGDNASEIANQNPKYVIEGTANQNIEEIAKKNGIAQVPVLDNNRKLVDIFIYQKNLISTQVIDNNTIIFLAGGEGSRLRPLTLETPKPLIKVGGEPIISIMINHFKNQGYQNYFVSVNYKKEFFYDFFKKNHNELDINFINEKQKLGTAGPITLIEKQKLPYVIINGDILSKINLKKLISFHNKNNADLTIVTKKFENKLPYGVIKSKGYKFFSIDEKPSKFYDIAAGIYIFSHKLSFKSLRNKKLDMPNLIDYLHKKKKKIITYNIDEYWIDIGNATQLNQAKIEFTEIFN